MSDEAAVAEKAPSVRRRGGGRAKGRGQGENGISPATNGDKKKVAATPLPPSMIGTSATGVISLLVVKKYKNKSPFGFINISGGEHVIYFNFEEFSDEKYAPLIDAEVTFTCCLDEKQRSFASQVRLTIVGKKAAAAIEEQKASRSAPGAGDGEPSTDKKESSKVPLELIGTKAIGIISKRGNRRSGNQGKFGFIDITSFLDLTPAQSSVMVESPRIYYALTSITSSSPGDVYYPRPGMEVELLCLMDSERNLPYAKDVNLTAAGKKAVDEKQKQRQEKAATRNEHGEEKEERKEKKTDRTPRLKVERKPVIELTPEIVGKSSAGIIDFVDKKKSFPEKNYGFIDIGASRIYFNFSDFDDATYVPRKGLEVSFVFSKDDADRPYASQVKLTDAGKATAATKEATSA